jgi:hypothetical protein
MRREKRNSKASEGFRKGSNGKARRAASIEDREESGRGNCDLSVSCSCQLLLTAFCTPGFILSQGQTDFPIKVS